MNINVFFIHSGKSKALVYYFALLGDWQERNKLNIAIDTTFRVDLRFCLQKWFAWQISLLSCCLCFHGWKITQVFSYFQPRWYKGLLFFHAQLSLYKPGNVPGNFLSFVFLQEMSGIPDGNSLLFL